MKIVITSVVDMERTAHGRLYQFAKYLAVENEVTLVSINDCWKAKQENVDVANTDTQSLLQRIDVKHLSQREVSPIIQELFSFRRIPKILEDIGYRAFDVHLNYNSLISGYIVSKKLKRVGIGTIYDIADDLPEMIRTSPQIPQILQPIGGFSGQIMLNKSIVASKVVTVAGRFLKKSVGRADVEVIPNGVDIGQFIYQPQNKLKSDLGLDCDFVLGYVGALREWVDLEPVFAAVRELRNRFDLKLLIVGGGEGFKRNKGLAERYGVTNEILFVGGIPYPQIPAYISCMDICLIPFKKNRVSDNSCPLKLFEYMSCERPVISTRISEVESIAEDRVTYASDQKEYVTEIIRLFDDEDLRGRMGSDGRVFVKENYDWSAITNKFSEIINDVGLSKWDT